jgi:hypothetical protein
MIIETLYMPTGHGGHRYELRPREEIRDFYPIDGPKIEHFTTGMSEVSGPYEDELYCPCGAVLPRGATLGDDIAFARDHLAKEHGR